MIIAVEGSEFMAAADAITILRHIEGSMAYIDSVGPRADDCHVQAFSAHADGGPSAVT